MTMKELIIYSETKRKQKCLSHHATVVAIHGHCKPFSQAEYKQIKTKQKQTFRKGKTFAFKNLWNHNNLTVA